jgi:hypothetical protein
MPDFEMGGRVADCEAPTPKTAPSSTHRRSPEVFTASQSRSRATGAMLTVGIVVLTLTTAYIHFSLGGLLFLLNAAGYATAAVAIVLVAWAPHPFIARFSWLPRVGLIGYTLVTIVGYLLMGPYFTLGFIAKGVEVVLIGLLIVDILRVYGSRAGLLDAARASLFGPATDPSVNA